ncbi:MAG: glycoside hydrolase family 32 protein [Chloroflexota bacterium]|nr:glycoside hydrolase family 32 protein [Chloroflexota bacterium]
MSTVTNAQALNYHLTHPGEDSSPGDPNAAFYLDGLYHLHYILRHPWRGAASYSFVHVTSPDMLHWSWQRTKLQPSFTGHGMFSGTGFLTKEGMPAAIYHGQASGRNHIAIAKDRRLSVWRKPYAVEPLTAEGQKPEMVHWDPDCFLVGDTYYAISGGHNPPLLRSADLCNWTYVGDFLSGDLPGTAIGEDISCPNFFPLGDKWMLLCISHPYGCRYYLGDWDAQNEQFAPEFHGRMNWRRPAQSLYAALDRDYFAPESLLAADGRRVMWAWLRSMDDKIAERSIQSLPRELWLGQDGGLRMRPLRELETLRHDRVQLDQVEVPASNSDAQLLASPPVAELDGDAYEIEILVKRSQAERKRFGLQLFADETRAGLPVLFLPEYGRLRVGDTEAPFALADLPAGEDIRLRIFVDKYLVEVFVNDRQALVACDMDYRAARNLRGYSFFKPTVLRSVKIWRMKASNQGFFEARDSRIWEVDSA